MATKKNVSKAKKTTTKETVKTSSKKGKTVKKGNKYVCDVCGLVISVDEVCGCVGMCDLICCGEKMKSKK